MRPFEAWSKSMVCAAALVCAGCEGQVPCVDCGAAAAMMPGPSVPDPSDPLPAADCSTPSPGASPIRRMTRAEYDATVRDLLGDTQNPARAFAVEEEALGFNNNAANLTTSVALAEKYMLAAEGIAARATAPGANRIGCDPASAGDDACARQFIDSFGKRAFRRPLTADEVVMFSALFTQGKSEGSFEAGVRMVIETALQSPAFLYRVELGSPVAVGQTSVRLTDWETASRLSYLLWGSMPDDTLLAAAEQGKLTEPADIEAQARRMLADPKAHDAVATFHEQWLDYDHIESVGKDAVTFPEFSPEIGALMYRETRAFLDDAVFGASGGFGALLTSSSTFLNAQLASFYGAAPVVGDELTRVALDPAQRSGVLTLGSLLTINAHSNQTSPVHRGKLVRERFLCATIPPPPPEVMIKAPEPDPNSTTRQRFAQHSEAPSCKACHTLMDPIGFGFENYDGMGRYRAMENGLPVDASGELSGTDVDGAFVGVAELAGKLAQSSLVRQCYATQWFRFAYGRGEGASDSCSLEALSGRFADSGGDIKELLVALTQTDAFLYRPAGGMP